MSHEPTCVVLEGDGVAAVCVARLLADASIPCVHLPAIRSKPYILLSRQTQMLLRTLFPPSAEHPEDIFEGCTPIRRRVVLWKQDSEPLDLPHQGVSVSEADLLDRLWKRVPAFQASDSKAAQHLPVWRVQTSRSVGEQSELKVGRCEATVCTIELRAEAQSDACWIEAVQDGWLFLLALGTRKAALIAVGAHPEVLLSASRLVARQVARMDARQTSFSAHPRLSQNLALQSVLRCGGAAMSFDPLCGEGAGNAVREALLAAAVIRASFQGLSVEQLTQHYSDRLRRGFLRHLETCLEFYTTGGNGSFWTEQAEALQRGAGTVKQLLEREIPASFRLVDRDLVPIASVQASRCQSR